MRYLASEKLEIIRLVEQSHLPARRALQQIGIPRSTFYRWCDLYRTGGPEALDDRSPRPDRVWNRIPDDVRRRIVTLALDESELSPRELAVRFTDSERYFVSEASVYRLLKAHDLITSPAFIVMKAADEFKDKTTAPNQLWQTDFTYLKVTGWGWFYLSTVLDDFSRYIVAWKLCTTMKADDVTDTLELALQASGLDQVNVAHRPRLLSDNGPSYVSTELAEWLNEQDMSHIRGAPYHPMTQGKIERWHLTLKNRILLENYYLPGELEAIVEQSLDCLFARIFGSAHYEERSLVVELQDESAIAEILRQAEAAFPEIYVKSRAKALGSTRVIHVTLSARGDDEAAVEALLAPAAERLLSQIAAAGYGVSPEPPAA